MWKLTIADDEEHQTVVNLVREQYTIGRSEGNTVRLTERNVSRKHARLTRLDDCYKIEDLSSYNGLHVNGLRLSGRQDLAHGDLIQLGDYRIQVSNDAIDTQEQGYRAIPEGPASRRSGRLPHRLVELIGPNQGAEFSLDGERFLLGRGTECEFTIDHGSVSRIHAEVRMLDEGRFEIIDKGSANGLRVNGHPLARALLDSRDVIELGDVVLKYIPKGQDFRANAVEGSRIAAMAGTAPPPAIGGKGRTGFVASLMAALVGAALVAAAATAYFRQESSSTPKGEDLPEELVATSTTLKAGRLIDTAEQLDKLSSATRSLGAYRDLELAWANSILRLSAQDLGQGEHRTLLDLVAKRATLPKEVRDAAIQRLTNLSEGAIDLGNLDGAAESEEE
jgi:pSer/pThr/pTyr-binding forkhead associated (FHA) protein